MNLMIIQEQSTLGMKCSLLLYRSLVVLMLMRMVSNAYVVKNLSNLCLISVSFVTKRKLIFDQSTSYCSMFGVNAQVQF